MSEEIVILTDELVINEFFTSLTFETHLNLLLGDFLYINYYILFILLYINYYNIITLLCNT